MKPCRHIFIRLLFAGLLACSAMTGRAGEALPPASEVTRRMLERAQAVAAAEQAPQYTYEKASLLEQLDDAGKATESEEKLYEVTLINGLPFNRLVKIQGRELSAEEAKQEQARQEKFRKQFVSLDKKKMVEKKEALLTPELLGRFEFVVKERILLHDRPTLVLTFKPKANVSVKAIEDKLLNRVAGTGWVDEEDADTARLEVRLVEPLSLGLFGWIGSLTRCELAMERQRMSDGVWVNTKQSLLLHYRKLTSTQHFRSLEESRNFKRAETGRQGG